MTKTDDERKDAGPEMTMTTATLKPETTRRDATPATHATATPATPPAHTAWFVATATADITEEHANDSAFNPRISDAILPRRAGRRAIVIAAGTTVYVRRLTRHQENGWMVWTEDGRFFVAKVEALKAWFATRRDDEGRAVVDVEGRAEAFEAMRAVGVRKFNEENASPRD